MERLDKIISNMTYYTRNDVKKLVRGKRIRVNDVVVSKSDIKIDENADKVYIDDEEIIIKKYVYLILNKPKGYVSATIDNVYPTVLDLVPMEYKNRDLFPAGRLDKDTTGLMIITDDGNFSHDILSPKHHVSKCYDVVVDIDITDNMVDDFKKGVKLSDGECKPSKLEIISNNRALVTLTEGRYHQIKRMFGCYGGKVLELKRISIGSLSLPCDLEEGMCRELLESELELVKKQKRMYW